MTKHGLCHSVRGPFKGESELISWATYKALTNDLFALMIQTIFYSIWKKISLAEKKISHLEVRAKSHIAKPSLMTWNLMIKYFILGEKSHQMPDAIQFNIKGKLLQYSRCQRWTWNSLKNGPAISFRHSLLKIETKTVLEMYT